MYFQHFSNNNLNYVAQLFYDVGNIKEWVKLKQEFNLKNNLFLTGCHVFTWYLKNENPSLIII